ncbi:hypothetical protein HMPREF0322_00259 [Desulfitobacterium hafniense DP7]|uniref:Uncharacterized protein n=1 Tax=Desulfitobacterium hafniense DP7 TaxID=537010 RepID=G9XH36_DESHA|nr:hypothetical protein HMPREF0322_00259 [Desulfitobacterium hafniense DP7]
MLDLAALGHPLPIEIEVLGRIHSVIKLSRPFTAEESGPL